MTDQNASRWDTDLPSDVKSLWNDGSAETVDPRRHSAALGGGLLLAGVGLAAANMRPAVTSLASILGEVRGDLGASVAWASVITSVPTLCFGLAGIAAPWMARRWGINRVVGIALSVLTVAMLLRVLDGPVGVFAGTMVSCASIAMCNVLIPVVVKESFPERVGMATALYTTAMAAGGAIGSGVTPMLTGMTGSWRWALATWAVVALAAACVWGVATRGTSVVRTVSGTPDSGSRSLMRNPLAWVVTVYFAAQSLVAYVVMGWLPEVFKSAGVEGTQAGALLGLLLLVGVPINMLLPPLVARRRSQSMWAVGLALIMATGLLGLLLAPLALPVLWALLMGVGLSAFPLALVFISLRTSNAADTGRLSAMSQSTGYLIASTGPFLFGMLHDFTGAWTVSLVALVCMVIAQGAVGFVAGRPRTI